VSTSASPRGASSEHDTLTSLEGRIDLSVLIPAVNEGPNLRILLPRLEEVLERLGLTSEILVVTTDGDVATAEAARDCGASVLVQVTKGYGGAIIDGVKSTSGDYVLTMDADLSHPPDFVESIWRARHDADITIASRYVPGGSASMARARLYLSRILNAFFRRGISMPIRDLSSGFRLYRRDILLPDQLESTDFDVLEEILIKAFCEGWQVQEHPFAYQPRRHGSSSVRLTHLGRAYLRAFWRLWKLRNSIQAADYDYRAYSSVIPLQRYWQRKRCQLVAELVADEGKVLDAGCGSSRILETLPAGSVALDILIRKLRYNRRFQIPLVHGSGFELPVRDESFPCVLSSQVIEHVPKSSPMIDELCRVLAPGGRLVLGTPDYDRKEWVYLEKIYARVAPGAYADEHVAHYTRAELISLLESKGLLHEATRYILRGELILAFRKPPVDRLAFAERE
jgi:dolichol-phosphate mannosyltransferase